jgi:hypothetical protein
MGTPWKPRCATSCATPCWRVLSLIPPMTQLNTPYPSTAYLTGFLRSRGVDAVQDDLALKAGAGLFSPAGLDALREGMQALPRSKRSPTLATFDAAVDRYRATIGPVIAFLQGRDPTLAHRIASRAFLPEGPRFASLDAYSTTDGGDPLAWAFGALGVQDKARHLATLYLNDWPTCCARPAIRASSSCATPNPWPWPSPPSSPWPRPWPPRRRWWTPRCSRLTWRRRPPPAPGRAAVGALPRLGVRRLPHRPDHQGRPPGSSPCWAAASSIPNCASSPSPASSITSTTSPSTTASAPCWPCSNTWTASAATRLVRTFVRDARRWVRYINLVRTGRALRRGRHPHLGRPAARRYLSMLDMLNPMHRLWSDGRWNKLTVAHGCYWKKCSFCDVSLDYIGRYDGASAELLVDRIEAIIAETGQTGFHFVDEAAPPKALRPGRRAATAQPRSPGGATSASRNPSPPSSASSSPTAAASPSPAGWKWPRTGC